MWFSLIGLVCWLDWLNALTAREALVRMAAVNQIKTAIGENHTMARRCRLLAIGE
jgi:hypothetical protein